jgi:hypothetical protein
MSPDRLGPVNRQMPGLRDDPGRMFGQPLSRIKSRLNGPRVMPQNSVVQPGRYGSGSMPGTRRR